MGELPLSTGMVRRSRKNPQIAPVSQILGYGIGEVCGYDVL
jgi:hypothetical protein